jgi:hypothetical protein
MKNNTNFLVVYIRLNVNISRHAKAKQGKVKDAYIFFFGYMRESGKRKTKREGLHPHSNYASSIGPNQVDKVRRWFRQNL